MAGAARNWRTRGVRSSRVGFYSSGGKAAIEDFKKSIVMDSCVKTSLAAFERKKLKRDK